MACGLELGFPGEASSALLTSKLPQSSSSHLSAVALSSAVSLSSSCVPQWPEVAGVAGAGAGTGLPREQRVCVLSVDVAKRKGVNGEGGLTREGPRVTGHSNMPHVPVTPSGEPDIAAPGPRALLQGAWATYPLALVSGAQWSRTA